MGENYRNFNVIAENSNFITGSTEAALSGCSDINSNENNCGGVLS